MKTIGINTLITSFKKDNLLLRIYPVSRMDKESIIADDDSFMTIPIRIIRIEKDLIVFNYLGWFSPNSRGMFKKEDLQIGKWLDGWKLYKIK